MFSLDLWNHYYIFQVVWISTSSGYEHKTWTKRKLQCGRLRYGGTHRRIANPVGRERLNHRRKPQFVYYANAIQRSNEVGGLLCGSWVYRTCAGKGLINESCTVRGWTMSMFVETEASFLVRLVPVSYPDVIFLSYSIPSVTIISPRHSSSQKWSIFWEPRVITITQLRNLRAWFIRA